MIRIRENGRRMQEREDRRNGDSGMLSLILILARRIVINVGFNSFMLA